LNIWYKGSVEREDAAKWQNKDSWYESKYFADSTYTGKTFFYEDQLNFRKECLDQESGGLDQKRECQEDYRDYVLDERTKVSYYTTLPAEDRA
jgi:hypothetical protein